MKKRNSLYEHFKLKKNEYLHNLNSNNNLLSCAGMIEF